MLDVTGTTTIESDGVLDFYNTASEAATLNLDDVVLNGGIIGGSYAGTLNCEDFTVTGTSEIKRVDLTVAGTTTVTGTLDYTATTGTKTFNGDVTVDGTWNNTSNESLTFGSDLTVNGTFNTSEADYTFTGTSKSIGGTAASITMDNATITGSYTSNSPLVLNSLNVEGTHTANENITISENATVDTDGLLNIDDATVDVDGNVTGAGDITFTDAGTLKIGGGFTNTGTFASYTGSTVEYYGSASDVNAKACTYYNVTINKASGSDLDLHGGTMNIGGELKILGGELDIRSEDGNGVGVAVVNVTGKTTLSGDRVLFEQYSGATTPEINMGELELSGGQLGYYRTGIATCTSLSVTGTGSKIDNVSLTVGGTTTITGTVDISSTSGTKTFEDDVTVNGTWNNSSNESVSFGADLIVDGTFNTSGADYTFTGTGKSIGGSASSITMNNATITGSYTSNSPLVLASLTVSGTHTANDDITVSASTSVGTGGLLNIDDATVDVAGSVTGAGNVTFTAAGTLKIGGGFTNTGTFTAFTGSTVEYYGSASDVNAKACTYYNVTINKATGSDVDLHGGTMNIAGELKILGGEFDIRSEDQTGVGVAVVNVTGKTSISGEGVLWEKYSGAQTPELNMGELVLSGGQLGRYRTGIATCTSMSVTGTGSKIDDVSLTVSGATNVTGELDISSYSGTKTFGGDVTIDGTWNNSSNEEVTFNSNLTVNGTFNTPGANCKFGGVNANISGTAANVIMKHAYISGTCTNNVATLSLKGSLTGYTNGTGTFINAANKTLEIGGNSDGIGTLTADANNNTVIYNGTIAYQAIKPATYYNMTVNNSSGGEIDLLGNTTISNHLNIISGWVDVQSRNSQITGKDLTMASGTRFEIKTRYNVTTPEVTVPQFTGTYTLAAGSTIAFDNDDQSQYISGVPTYANVIFSNIDNRATTPKVLQGNLHVNGDLSIIGKADLDVSTNNYSINVGGDWINTSANTVTTTFKARNGTVSFDGSATQEITTNSGEETFYNLNISNSGNTVLLNNDIKISSQLDFTTSGYINLNSNTLTIDDWDNGDIPSLGTDRYVIGDNTSSFTVNGVDNGETVNMPMGFSSSSADFCRVDVLNNDAANTSFSLSPCNYLNAEATCSGGSPVTTGSVNITWHITSASTDADVSLYWDESKELTGFDRTSCDIYHMGSNWANLNGYNANSTLSGTIHYITVSTNSFSPFAVASENSPLPIELLSFDAVLDNDIVELLWQTASEINNDYFTIERSQDGVNWEDIGQVSGAGNSNVTISYEWFDMSPLSGVSYYRLKQTDYDGKYSFSQTITINRNQKNIDNIDVYPNPFQDEISINFRSISDETFQIKICNALGSIVFMESLKNNNSIYNLKLNKELPKGIYFVTISDGSDMITRKLVKE